MKYTTKYDSCQLPIVLDEKRKRYRLRGNTGLNPNLADSYSDDFISITGVTKRDIADEIFSVNRCSRHIAYISANQVDNEGVINEVAGAVLESDACNNTILCPQCAAHRRNDVIQSVSLKMKTLDKMDGLYFYMLTLTVPSCGVDSIRSNYNLLRDSWTDFVKMGQRRGGGGRSGGEMGKCIGYVLGIETVKRNNFFHIHGHCFVVTTAPIDYSTYDQDKKVVLKCRYGNNIPKDELLPISTHLIRFRTASGEIVDVPLSSLSRQWYESTGGRAVDIHCIPISRKYYDFISGDYKRVPLVTNAYEVVKYATKMWEVEKDELVKLWVNLGGTRRVTKGGIFSGSRFYSDLWKVLVDKNNCREFYHNLITEFSDSTLSDERCKFHAFRERIDFFEYCNKSYVEKDSTFLKEKYSDLDRKGLFDVLRGVVVSGFLKHKRNIVTNIDILGAPLSVIHKNRLTDIMRGLMRGINNCLYVEITGNPVKGKYTEIVGKLVSRLREELFFGKVLRKSKSFIWVSSEINRYLTAFI